MRDGGQLIPGQQYRITDFVTTAVGDNIRSASHPFDILVTALTENTLSDDARAAIHAGDTYFRNSRLDAWKLKYSLDNSISLFYAADPQGKGVIYYMMDEGNNECPYDFKNIQFKRWKATDSMEVRSGLNGKYIMTRPNFTLSTHLRSGATGDFRWFFTFSASDTATNPTDRSLLPNSVHDNSVDGQRSILSTVLCGSLISRNRILANETTIINSPHDNVLNSCNLMIGGFSYSDFFDCTNIVMGNSCDHIIMNGNSNCSFGSSVANIQALAKSMYYDLPNSARKVFIMPGVLLSGDHSIPGLVPNASYMQIVFKDVDGSVKVMPVCSKTVNVEWATLKAMRDGGQLIPGQQYRITDYVTTVNQHTNQNSRSAGHAFDIIVTALDSSTLSEQASAIQHEGDTYFKDARLEAWELKYRLDNVQWSKQAGTYVTDEDNGYTFLVIGDITLSGHTYKLLQGFGMYVENWSDYALMETVAEGETIYCYYGDPEDFDPEEPEVVGTASGVEEVTEAGKGTITWMKDEWGNEAGYDFKNVQFKRWKVTDSMEGRTGFTDTYLGVLDNTAEKLSVEDAEDFIWAYTFSSDAMGGEQTDYSLDGTHSVYGNIIKEMGNGSLPDNVFFGENCYANTLSQDCSSNSFSQGCQYNSFSQNVQYVKLSSNYMKQVIVESGNQHLNVVCNQSTTSSQPCRNIKIEQGVGNTTSEKTVTITTRNQNYQTVVKNANSVEVTA